VWRYSTCHSFLHVYHSSGDIAHCAMAFSLCCGIAHCAAVFCFVPLFFVLATATSLLLKQKRRKILCMAAVRQC